LRPIAARGPVPWGSLMGRNVEEPLA
jgi:hypothetical protein